MTPAILLAVAATTGLTAPVNVQLILGILLAISEVLGADPRIKANGIVSFIILQVANFLKTKKN